MSSHLSKPHAKDAGKSLEASLVSESWKMSLRREAYLIPKIGDFGKRTIRECGLPFHNCKCA